MTWIGVPHGDSAALPDTMRGEPHLLRLALPLDDVNLDPAQPTTAATRQVTGALFDSLMRYDSEDEPAHLVPLVLSEEPWVSPDYQTFRFQLRPDLYFHDDPVFGGVPRELVAADFVYTFRRLVDPQTRSPVANEMLGLGIRGLQALVKDARRTGRMDYDRPIEGLRVLSRYVFEMRLDAPRPQLLNNFADGSTTGAVAREVIEAYGPEIGRHPVGTGAFRLAAIADSGNRLEFVAHDHGPHGRPALRKVSVMRVMEAHARWLAFLRGEIDALDALHPEAMVKAFGANGSLAPWMRARHVQGYASWRRDVTLSCFRMADPVVGGLGPQQVALRRAIGAALDIDREIRMARRGHARAAASFLAQETDRAVGGAAIVQSRTGPAWSKALLDTYGWIDRDGDGWRDRPDGTPLVIEYAVRADGLGRDLGALWLRDLAAVGIKARVTAMEPTALRKAALSGRLMAWQTSLTAGSPDPAEFLALGASALVGKANLTGFQLAAFDQSYDQSEAMAPGAERDHQVAKADRLLQAYLPCKPHVHTLRGAVARSSVTGWRPRPFEWSDWYALDVRGDRPTSGNEAMRCRECCAVGCSD